MRFFTLLFSLSIVGTLVAQPVSASLLEWPLERAAPWEDIASTFGPRLKASDNFRYDFHRGIDIKGELTDEILAMADGEVYRIYYEGQEGSPYTNGGTVVLLKHTADPVLTIQGTELDTFYTIYMHMSAIEGGLAERDTVTTGQRLGLMGQTGTTETTHLHFEVRLGTVCSIYNECNSTEFDPHVNPMKYLVYPQTNTAKVRLQRDGDQLRVRVKTAGDEADFNRIQVTTRDKNGKKLKRKTINLNNRAGIDTTSLDTMDTASFKNITITPKSFSNDTAYKILRFDFDNILTSKAKRVTVYLSDTNGNRMKVRTTSVKRIQQR